MALVPHMPIEAITSGLTGEKVPRILIIASSGSGKTYTASWLASKLFGRGCKYEADFAVAICGTKGAIEGAEAILPPLFVHDATSETFDLKHALNQHRRTLEAATKRGGGQKPERSILWIDDLSHIPPKDLWQSAAFKYFLNNSRWDGVQGLICCVHGASTVDAKVRNLFNVVIAAPPENASERSSLENLVFRGSQYDQLIDRAMSEKHTFMVCGPMSKDFPVKFSVLKAPALAEGESWARIGKRVYWDLGPLIAKEEKEDDQPPPLEGDAIAAFAVMKKTTADK